MRNIGQAWKGVLDNFCVTNQKKIFENGNFKSKYDTGCMFNRNITRLAIFNTAVLSLGPLVAFLKQVIISRISVKWCNLFGRIPNHRFRKGP